MQGEHTRAVADHTSRGQETHTLYLNQTLSTAHRQVKERLLHEASAQCTVRQAEERLNDSFAKKDRQVMHLCM